MTVPRVPPAPPSEPVPWPVPTEFPEYPRPEFPLATLTLWLRTMVAAQAEFAQTPLGLPGGMALAVLATVTSRRFEIRLPGGHREPLNIYAAITSRPGTRKSSTVRSLVDPLLAWERQRQEAVRPEYEAAASERRILEFKRTALEKRLAKAKAAEVSRLQGELHQVRTELQEFVVPVLPRLVTDDVTPEKVVGLLKEQGGGIAVLSAEGDSLEIMAGRYNAQGRPNLGVFLKGHAGDPLIVDRMGRPGERVERPRLTIGITIQPTVLDGLTAMPSFRGRGLLGRFLYVLPDDLLGQRRIETTPIPAEIQEEYDRALTHLLDLPEDELFGPTILSVSPGAWAAFQAFSTWLEPQLAEGARLGHVTDWAGKLPGAIARLAGLLHVGDSVERTNGIEVSLAVMERAIELGRYFLAHAVAAFGRMGADPVVVLARRVIRWLGENGQLTVTRRDIFRGCQGTFQTVDEMEPVERLLVRHEYLRPQPETQPRGPGRPPSPVFEVNPHLLNSSVNCGGSVTGGSDFSSHAAARSGQPTEPEQEVTAGPADTVEPAPEGSEVPATEEIESPSSVTEPPQLTELPPEPPEGVLAPGATCDLVQQNGDLALVSHDRTRVYASAAGEPGTPGVLEGMLQQLPVYLAAQREDLRRMRARWEART
jgi:replicative DNA helicase